VTNQDSIYGRLTDDIVDIASSLRRSRVSMMAVPSAVRICQSAPLFRISPLSNGPAKLCHESQQCQSVKEIVVAPHIGLLGH
jgi:hypothetical protein